MWNDRWQRVDRIAEELTTHHPESFRHQLVRCRNGEQREIWAFTKSDPSCPEAFNFFGKLQDTLGETQEAIKNYRVAIAM